MLRLQNVPRAVWSKVNTIDVWLPLLLGVAAVIFRFIYEYHQYDDAFITFRYVLNLLDGKGFVYNEGRRVLGTTTPLFTILLAGLGRTFRTHNIPFLANLINHLADGGSAVLLYLIGRRLWPNRTLPSLMSLFYVFSFHSVFYSSTGMETSFFTFLVLFSLERALQGRVRASLTFTAFALITRPDALILVVTLLVFWLANRQRVRIFDVVPPLAALICCHITLYLYFGSIVPHSAIAKLQMWQTGTQLFSFKLPNYYEVMMFWSGYLTKSHSQKNIVNIIQLVPMLGLFGLGCLELARQNRRMLLLPGFCLLFTAAYMKVGGFIFPWYLIPTVPYLVLTTFAGLKWLATILARQFPSWRSKPARPAATSCALMLVMQSLVFIGSQSIIPSAIARYMYPSHTEKLYRHALSLVQPKRLHCNIMAPEPGYIGYYRPEVPIIDPIGLTNPEVTAFYNTHHDALPKNLWFVNPAVVNEFQPDYIISIVPFVDPRLEETPAFTEKYEKIEVPLDESFTNREPVALYKKRGA